MSLLTAKQVREILNISQSTLARWKKLGKIKFVPVAKNSYRYPSEDVDRILKEGNIL